MNQEYLLVDRAVNIIKKSFQKLCLEDQDILGKVINYSFGSVIPVSGYIKIDQIWENRRVRYYQIEAKVCYLAIVILYNYLRIEHIKAFYCPEFGSILNNIFSRVRFRISVFRRSDPDPSSIGSETPVNP